MANLSGADLHKANLRWADLSRVNLNGAKLGRAQYDQDTKWPDGFDPKRARAILQE